MTRVMSLRFQEDQMERLGRVARRFGRSPSQTAVLLVEEALRQAEFGHIDFRDSPVGRQAYVRGSSLAVWEVASLARSYGGDARRVAEHLQWPVWRVEAALRYAAAFPEEIENAIRDNESFDWEEIQRMLPQAEQFSLSAALAKRSEFPQAGS